jgi:ACS family glucarate transporter-like MFS transporter
MNATVSVAGGKSTHFRFAIVALLFMVTAINYADRSALGITGPALSKDLGLNAAQMGFILSAFGWAYVIGQVPGGWLLDRFGSKAVYAASLFLWSLFTFLQSIVGVFDGGLAIAAMFSFLFLMGFSESPAFPANSRIVAAWFPGQERGTASAIFNSAQYFATVMFAPLMGWITNSFGWPWVFRTMGTIGFLMTIIWLKVMGSPSSHPRVNRAEIDYIAAGGGLVNLDQKKEGAAANGPKWSYVRQIFASRMMVGIFVGQFAINALTYFFITWFPIYLVQARGMSILKAGLVASIPAVCGFVGGIIGGVLSDFLLRKGWSLSVARKTPIVLGMTLALAMIGCNYTDIQWVVVALMALSFFGKGLGALGWAVLSDTAPKQITGLTGGVFNMCGNLSSISTPIVIGLIVQWTGSFNGALVFVGANALLAAVSFLVVVGEIKRLELKA